MVNAWIPQPVVVPTGGECTPLRPVQVMTARRPSTPGNRSRPATASGGSAAKRTVTYPCKLCKSVFSRKDHLRRHVLIHTGERSLECDVCKSRFARQDHLLRHRRVHFNNKPVG